MSKPSRLTAIHSSMKRRCYNPKCKNYNNYGGRGITVCEEWLDNEKISFGNHSHNITKGFLAFKEWALENGYADNLSLDRIDNNKGYYPKNCRWVTQKIQNNNKRNNLLISYKGKIQSLKQWCEELNLCYNKMFQRIILKHWTVKRAFEQKGDARVSLISYKNKTKPLSDWCKELNLNYRTVSARLNKLHWSVEEAFETK